MPEQSANLKPGWCRVKFGDVVRLSKARSQDKGVTLREA